LLLKQDLAAEHQAKTRVRQAFDAGELRVAMSLGRLQPEQGKQSEASRWRRSLAGSSTALTPPTCRGGCAVGQAVMTLAHSGTRSSIVDQWR
jgi:hypothetical protein